MPDGFPYPNTRIGCGGCLPDGCEICAPALACDGKLVTKLMPQQKVPTVHLRFFAEFAMLMDYAPRASKCKQDSSQVATGTLRLLVVVPKHNGLADSPIIFRLRTMREKLKELWTALAGFDVERIRGLAEVAPDHRDWVITALRGEVGPADPPPTSAPTKTFT